MVDMKPDDQKIAPEDLGRDRNEKMSSGPRIKTGPNRGRRHPEKGGRWEYVDGYLWGDSRRAWSCACWTDKLIKLGHRIGKCHYEGVASFYIFVKESE